MVAFTLGMMRMIHLAKNQDLPKKTNIFFTEAGPEVLYKRRCSEKFRKFSRKTPVPESLFK